MTRRAVVIGSPISQSLSPAIHGAAFAELGLDWTYGALEVAPSELAAVVEAMRRGEMDAMSVTMPHKESITALVDDLSDDARLLGAANCVWREGSRLRAAITDGEGCCDALEQQGGARLAGARVQVIGAGGTARAVALSLVRRGAHVLVENRTPDRAEALVSAVAGTGPGTGGTISVGRAVRPDVVVNATSVGMNTDEVPLDPARISPGTVVLDAVYSPLSTRLLVEAASRGAVCVDGLWMLIHQARHQEMLWFGRAGSAETMRAESLRVLALRGK